MNDDSGTFKNLITKVDYTNVFTFGRIIQIPVDAVVDANINASVAAFNFIKKFGFEEGPDPIKDPDKLGDPKMLTFSYKYNNGGVEQKMVVNIPVLSLVTMPFLNVRKAKFDIGINILNQIKTNKTKAETLVLLGPTEGNISKRDNDTDVNKTYTNEFSTNMQASIEVESTDLPSGILQMINLFKDATNGSGKDVYILDTKQNKIQFSATQTEVSIDVFLTKDKKPIKNGLIVATVVSDTDADLHDTFSHPIRIKKGSLVGNPALGQAKALTNKKGKVTFTFSTYKINPLGKKQNGFIYFKTAKASKIAVYYHLKT
ncbi:DUF2589 domain-containing protein [uncultured Psychroserpens sp.]|uniref:DUF2589 domain-containing protein n=1 Tax=uncultured Psychroserpens sp. TaxID=255436 RepID=UPI00260E69E6|nr:DUF2589 domain-containing protein [uncultured Psychroserpens sp.]